MANDDYKVRRTLQLKFVLPAADPSHILALVKAASPFYEMFGSTRVRLLQNVDDPSRFIQEIEYETDETIELNRQRFASDSRLQSWMQAWRALLPGGVEIDVYKDV